VQDPIHGLAMERLAPVLTTPHAGNVTSITTKQLTNAFYIQSPRLQTAFLI
jgi:hypothetical protein